MSDSLITVMELLREVLEEETLPQSDQPEYAGIKGAGAKDEQKGKEYLDVSNIVRNLVAATTSPDKDRQNISDSFATLRSFNKDLLSDLSSADKLNKAIVSFYQVPDAEQTGRAFSDCNDLATISARALINAGLQTILREYNAQTAGFVNEAYLANLLGGKVIPVGKDIADLKVGEIGISLKTKKEEAKTMGSYSNLLHTLGIPHEIQGKKDKPLRSDNETPLHTHLYYVAFAKKDNKVSSIKTIKIDGKKVLDYLIQKGSTIRVDENQGTKTFISSDVLQTLKKDTNFFLNAPIKDWSANLGGVGDFSEITFSTQESEKQSKKAAGLLGEQLTATLNQINNYFGVIEQAMVTYASQPTRENLKKLQEELSEAAKFGIEDIIVCSKK
jgi:hypothetical protein